MKVLLLPSWYPDSKKPLNGVFFKEQAEALSKEGIEVIVLSINIRDIRQIDFKEKLNKLEVSIENNITVYRYNTYNYFPKMQELYLKYYSILVNKMIKKILSKEGHIDIVHIHSALDMGIAYSKSRLDLPYVITEHSTKYSRKLLNNTQKKYLTNVFSKADRVLVVGNGLKNDISEYIDKSKIEVIPNLVKMPEINISKESNNKNKKFRFFSLGFLTFKKGMDLLIEAFNLGRNELKNVELFIGGNGEEMNNLKTLISRYNLSDNIFLLGELSREEVAINMNECDCFILTSRFETFGIVYIEAMNYGKPVIASITGGPDTFINEKCGLLVKNENIDEIKNAMIKMISEYDKYDKYYISRFCENNFSENVVANKLVSIYREVIKDKDVT
ncbi:glycosyltransferase [Clostridium nigeriense]|uniref:glycosyltransferase n=1 Tax=Clostridium nigeriense TaxID=1805470 RepID=UPI003D343E6E